MGLEAVRKYGVPPYKIAVIHGGPGAPGYMAPVARELAAGYGVIEPLQSEDTLSGQIRELREQLNYHADLPVTLIGSSWGALLAMFTAAQYGHIVKKLILIGCAVFDRDNSAKISVIRMNRIGENTRAEFESIQEELEKASDEKRGEIALKWGNIFFQTDVFDPLTNDLETIEVQYDLNRKVWADFVELRDRPGYLADEFSKVNAPVSVIHGDYDPHPIEGIRPFLKKCLANVNFHILPDCGHYPWIERRAKKLFYEVLRKELL